MTGERRPLIAANWKMNKTNAEAAAFCSDFRRAICRRARTS